MYEFMLGKVMTAPKTVNKVKVRVSLHQHEVFVKREDGGWLRVGYCSDKPGMPVNLIHRFDDEFKDLVKAFVEKEIGQVKSVHQPPEPQPEPEEEPEEYDDDDSDEEE